MTDLERWQERGPLMDETYYPEDEPLPAWMIEWLEEQK